MNTEIPVVPDPMAPVLSETQYAFLDIGVGFKSPKAPGEFMEGRVRVEYKFGEDRDDPKQRLIVAGTFKFDFYDKGLHHGDLEFTPGTDSPNYEPMRCDIRKQVYDANGAPL